MNLLLKGGATAAIFTSILHAKGAKLVVASRVAEEAARREAEQALHEAMQGGKWNKSGPAVKSLAEIQEEEAREAAAAAERSKKNANNIFAQARAPLMGQQGGGAAPPPSGWGAGGPNIPVPKPKKSLLEEIQEQEEREAAAALEAARAAGGGAPTGVCVAPSLCAFVFCGCLARPPARQRAQHGQRA